MKFDVRKQVILFDKTCYYCGIGAFICINYFIKIKVSKRINMEKI